MNILNYHHSIYKQPANQPPAHSPAKAQKGIGNFNEVELNHIINGAALYQGIDSQHIQSQFIISAIAQAEEAHNKALTS